MKVILYPRVSSLDQAKNDSIEAQELRLRQFCEQNNYEIVDVYTDAGKSASIKDDDIILDVDERYMQVKLPIFKRPAFKRILFELKNRTNNYDAVVFFKYDRLNRNNIMNLLTILWFKKYAIKLIPSDDSNEKLIIFLKSFFSEDELIVKNERIRSTRLLRFDKGMFVAKAPYGYKPVVKDKRVIDFKPDIKDSNIVKRLFELTVKGVKYSEICSEVKIAPQQYYNIIRNKNYCGYVLFECKEKKHTHEIIVSEEIWNEANKILKDRRHS